jgi:hypothetical protein
MMTTSFLLEPQPFRRGPSAEIAVVVGLASGVTVLALFLAGAAFLGLAIAPIASPAAEAFHLRIADFWWLFAGFSIASFAAAATVAVKASAFLSSRD